MFFFFPINFFSSLSQVVLLSLRVTHPIVLIRNFCKKKKKKIEITQVYSSPAEYEHRLAVFAENLARIDRLNHQGHATFGVNAFAGLSLPLASYAIASASSAFFLTPCRNAHLLLLYIHVAHSKVIIITLDTQIL
jgi:hypothetical protein